MFYWSIIGLNALQLGWKTVDLARGHWQQPAPIRHIVFKILGVIPIALVLSLSDHVYVLLKNPTADQATQYGQNLKVINSSVHLGLSVVCAIVVIQLVWEIGRMASDEYRRREAAK
jgi:hypothetical protein